MKLKRVTAVLLAGVMAMGLVACGSGSDMCKGLLATKALEKARGVESRTGAQAQHPPPWSR